MSQRRNTRRSIWTTISRRRRPAPQAPRFAPNRAPSLTKLFAGTALGCTFLAFMNAPAARAADLMVNPGPSGTLGSPRGVSSQGSGGIPAIWGAAVSAPSDTRAPLNFYGVQARSPGSLKLAQAQFDNLSVGSPYYRTSPGVGLVVNRLAVNIAGRGAGPDSAATLNNLKLTNFTQTATNPCGAAPTTGDDVCTLDPTIVVSGTIDGLDGGDTIRLGTVQDSTVQVGALGTTFTNFEAIDQAGPFTTTLSNGTIPSNYSLTVSGGTLVLDNTVVVSPNSYGVLVTGGELRVENGSYVSGALMGVRVQSTTSDVTVRVEGVGTAIYQNSGASAIGGYSAAHDLTIVGGVGAAARVGSPYTGVISAVATSGDVSVTWDGTLTGAGLGNGYGIYAHGYTGDVSVSLGGSITNVGTGIWNTTSGDASVDVDGYISASERAVYARSDASVTVTGSGALYGATGIWTRTAGTAAPTLIDFDGTVRGDLHAVDAASLMGDSDLTIILGGVAGSNNGAAIEALIADGTGDLSVTFEIGASVVSGHGALEAFNYGSGATSITVEDGAHLYGGVYVRTFGTAEVTVDGTIRNEFAGLSLANSHDAIVTVGATGSVYSHNGYAIVGTVHDDHISVAGEVIGGLGAINVGPGADTITLYSTASIVGRVVGGSDIDTLELAGPGSGTVNVGQFEDFELGHATGGTWSLTGTDSAGLAWTIDNGATLNVTSDSLNADVVDNGVLQLQGSGAFTENVSGAGVVQAVGGGTVTVNGDITTWQGLQAVNTNLTVGGDVTAAYGRGVYASSTGVDLSIDGASTSDISARSTGILAVGTTGAVTVNWQGDISSGYHGVYAHTNKGGDVSITVGDVVSTFGEGVFGRTSFGGDITIHTLGAVTESGDSGIRATAYGGGDVSLTAEGDVHAYNYGITAFSDSGSVTVTTNGLVTADRSAGISMFGGSTATATVNGAVSGGRDGVAVSAVGFADVNINADVTGGRDGVRGGIYGGSIDIDIAAGADVVGGRYGVYASDRYSGGVSVTVDGTVTGDATGVRLRSNGGNLEVLGSGDISSANSDGINANTGGSGTVSIINTGTIDAGGVGVFAGTTAGDIDIDVADVTAAGAGVSAQTGTGGIQIAVGDVQSNSSIGIVANINNASAASDINIGVSGTVQGYSGIIAGNAGSGGVVIDVQGIVAGTGFGAGAHAIQLTGASSDVTIGYTGTVTSNSQVGLVGTSGSDVVRIQGTLAGFNGAADLGGGDDTVYLYAGAHVYGAFSAGTGYDRLFLTGSGDATFDFDSGQFAGFDYGRIIGTGHWTLQGTDTIGFGWSVGPGGTLDGDTNSFNGDITDNGTVNFDQSFDGTFEHDVTGTGNLTVQGGATLTFTGNLSIDGGIDILDSSGVEMDGSLTTTGDGIYTNITGEVNIGVGGDIVSGGDGVDATATGGRVIVTTDGGSSITAGGDGIVAHSDIGISIYNNGTIVADPGMNLTATGNADIYVNSAGAITADNGGIVTSAEAGPTLIKVSATVEGDDDNNGVGNGIQSASTTGSITIHNYAGGDIVGDNASGIVATSQTGAIDIDGDLGVGIQADSTGIFATASGASAGGIDIDWLGSISAGGDGVYASLTSGGATGDVDVTVGAVTAGGVGVLAQTWGSGDVNVTLEGATTAGSFGVQANNHGSGDVFVTTTASGDISGDTATGIYSRSNVGNVTVTADGDIGSAANHVSGYGIQTVSTGAGLITIQGSGAIYADSIGIAGRSHSAGGDVTIDFDGDITSGAFGVLAIAIAGGDSDLAVTTGGAITSATTGVYASNLGGTGDVDVTVNGSIFAGTGSGILVRQSASSDVNVTTTAAGDIITDSNYGVRVNNYGTGDTTLNLAGDLGSLANPITFAVNARTTGVDTLLTVNTSGAIYGSILLAATGAASDISVDVSGPVSNGMFIRSYGAGDTDVTLDVSGHVSGGTGILAGVYSGGSTGLVDVGLTGQITASSSGIRASNAGVGGVVVTTGAASVIDGTANYGVNVTANGGTIDIDTNGTIGSLADRVNTMGVFATQTGVNGQIDVSVGGTIYSASQGVTVRTTNTGGDSQVTVSGMINAPFGVTSRAYVGGDSDVSIDVSATGSIVGASNAVYGGVMNAANTGTVDIDFSGAINATNVGLWAVNNGTGGIDITTYAGSSISGNAANGIIANAASGAVVVASAGDIGSAANEVSGNGIYGRNPAAGSISLTNSGDIFADQFGVYGRATGSASITIDNAGDVTAGRTGLRAIGSTGAVSVSNSGTVTVDGTNPNTSSMGVYAFTNNNVSVDNDGDITVVSNDTNIVAGMRIVANNGFAEVYSAGDINVTRTNGSANTHGIVITDSDLGAHVVADGDIFLTTGGENFGAIVVTSGGAVDIDAAYFNVAGSANGAGIQVNAPGAVTVNLTEGHVSGVNAEAVVVYGSLGTVNVNVGEVSTSGADSQGILVGGGATGAVNVTADSVLTNGAGANGIEVTTLGHIAITATDVTTQSGGAIGIRADGDSMGMEITTLAGGALNTSGRGIDATTAGSSGTIDINALGTITAGGVAINAVGGTGLVDIVSRGAITGSAGIVGSTGGAGDVTIYAAASVTGLTGPAISAATSAGDIGVTVDGGATLLTASNNDAITATTATGTITVTAANGADLTAGFTGIYAHVTGSNGALVGPAIDIDWTGGLTAAGSAIYAITQDGDIAVSLNGADAGLFGVRATSGTGDISVINTGTIYSNGVANGARGIFVDTGGDIYISSTAIYAGFVTANANVEGIRAQGASVEIHSGLVETNATTFGNGINVIAGAGGATVTSDSVETSGSYGRGIVIATNAGVSVDSGYVHTTGFGSAGIDIYGGAGAIDIVSDSVVTEGNSSVGIVARGSGAITIDSGSVDTAGSSSTGILVLGDTGAIDVTSASVTADGSIGIRVLTNGDASVVSGDVTSLYNGIWVTANGAGYIGSTGTVTTTGLQGDGLVLYAATADINLTGTIHTSGYDAEGILVLADGAVNIYGGGDITTTGPGGAGVFARSQGGGDISVTLGDIVTAGGDLPQANGGVAHGAYIRTAGSVDVTLNSVSVSGATADGVNVAAGGNVSLDIGSIQTTGGNAATLVGAGGVSIDVTGAIRGGGMGLVSDSGAAATSIRLETGGSISTSGDAIHATSTTGDIYIYAAAGTSITSTYGDGIDASSGGGSITVVSYANISGDPGVILSTTGAGNIDFDSFGSVTGDQGGIVLSAEAGTITLDVYGTVEGDDDNSGAGNAIQATVTTGSISIHTNATGDIVGDNANGIVAQVTGAGATGGIGIISDGDIGTSLTAVDGVGIYAVSLNGGSASVSITGSGDIYAGFAGVMGRVSGADADVYMNLSGNVTGGYNGIVAGAFGSGDTDITVTTSGLITASNNAIEGQITNAGSTGTVTANVNGDVNGGRGVSLVNLGSGEILINTAAASDITATLQGVNGYSGGLSDMTLVLNGDITAGDRGVQLNVGGVAQGDLNVTVYGDIIAGNTGLFLNTGSGAVVANLHGDITGDSDSSGLGNGVTVQTTTGSIDVHTFVGADISGDTVTGVRAVASGDNTTHVSVDIDGDIGSAGNTVSGDGVQALMTSNTSTGLVNVTGDGDVWAAGAGVDGRTYGTGDVSIDLNGDIHAGGVGISAYAFGAGDTDLTVFTDGAVTAGASGIVAYNGSVLSTGDITITANAAISASFAGVMATNRGTGATVVTTGVDGDISGTALFGIAANTSGGDTTIHNNGDIGSALDRVTFNGVGVTSYSGSGTILIDGSGAIFADQIGILVNAQGAGGDIVVNLTSASADIVAGTTGISLAATSTGDSDITVFTNGTISAGNAGIRAVIQDAANTGDLSVTANDAITGTLSLAGIYGVNLGSGVVTINTGSAGDISGNAARGVYARSASGAITVTANGDIGSAANAVTNDGITARETSGSALVLVNGSGAIFAGQVGIRASADGADADVTVNLTAASADISAGSDGIQVRASGTGDSDLTVFTNGTIQAGANGVDASILNAANSGTITVTTNDTINATGRGVRTQTNGTGAIVITSNGAVTSGASGLVATSTTGAVNLYANADITAATGDAVLAQSSNGDIYVSTAAIATLRATAGAGVEVRTTATTSGDILIESRADIVAGTDGILALAQGTGDSDVTVNSTGAISAGQDGIEARITNAANTGTLTVTATDAITGALSGWGVLALNSGTGSTTVTTGAAGDISGNAYGGVWATARGGVTVHNNGDIGALGNAVTSDGVRVNNGAGTGDVLVDGAGAIFAGGRGIDALNFAAGGDVTVNLTDANADIVSGGQGIRASALGAGDGDVTVFTNGTVTSGGHGIYGYAFFGGTGTITVTANAVIDAQGNGIRGLNYGVGGIVINQAATGDITGNATTGISAQATGGAIVIHNNGDIGSAANSVTNDGVLANQFGSATGSILVDGAGPIFAGDDGIDARVGANALDTDVTIDLTNAAADITAGDDGVSVTVAALGDSDVSVFTNGSITAGGDGVTAVISNAANTGSVTIRTHDTVIATSGDGLVSTAQLGTSYVAAFGTVAAGDDGIVSIAAAGSGSATAYAHGAINAGGDGMVVISNGGLARAFAYDTISATTGMGVFAHSYGAGYVRAFSNGVSAQLDGMNVGSNGGQVLVESYGDITSTAGDGIHARNTSGNIAIYTEGGFTITAVAGDGIDAATTGGSVSVNSHADIVADPGILIVTGGAGNIDVQSFGTITANNGGIVTSSQSGYNHVRAYNTIEGDADNNGTGDAIHATSNGGDVLVYTSAAGDIVGNNVNGIYAGNSGATASGVTVTQLGDIGTAGLRVDADGIDAFLTNAGSTADVLVNAQALIFAGDDGIYGFNAGSGDVTVTTSAAADIVATTAGIRGISVGAGDSDITITANGTINSGFHGIWAQQFSAASTGTILITANDAIVSNTRGVNAVNAGTGGVDITTSAAGDISGNALIGIVATAAGGNVEVTNNGDIGSAGNAVTNEGVYALLSVGSGTITVDGSGAIFAGGNGIWTNASGAGADTLISLTSPSADIVAGGSGIVAQASNTGDNDITILTNGTISAGANGVYARNTGAANTGSIVITANDAITGALAGWGVQARTAGSGDVRVTTGANGDIAGTAFGGVYAEAGGGITISNAGDIGTSGDFVSNDGVRAIGNGAGTILINGTGAIFAGDDGVDARALGAGGDITVTLPSSATIRSVDDGIYALASSTGDSDINLTFSGTVISSAGNGIDARITNALNTGTLIINANASVTAGGGAAIRAENQGSGGTTINIAAGSVVTGQANFAIDTEGNGSTINNAGTINGLVDLSAGADTVNNTGLWNALGTSVFGAATDTVNNTGRVEVAPASVAGTTVLWTGLEGFNNNGGVVDLRQGHTGDVFTLSGTTFTGATVGLNSSRLQIDAFLASPLTSDRLNIGAAAGTTTVQLVDLAAAQNGALDLTGAVVVDATAGAASAFTLEGGPIQKGFVTYDLVFDATNFDWRLMGLPSDEAFQMIKLGSAAQDFWSHSADAWSNRMGEVRDSQFAAAPTRSEGWEMWGQALVGGRETTSTPTYTLGIASLTPDLSTESSWRGLQSGADNLQGNVLYGITGGFVQQDTDFKNGRNGFDFEGFNVGGYAGWTSGAFFLNGLAKADWYTVDVNMRSVPAMAHLDGMTYGAKAEAGFRFGGQGLWIEPKADVAWSSTKLDNAAFSNMGTTFEFDNATSLQSSIGARVGGTWGGIAPYVGLWAVNESGGANGMTMLTGPGCPSCVTLRDQPAGSFGKVEYGFTVLNWNGLEGFVKGETRFNGDAKGTDLNLGVRWRW